MVLKLVTCISRPLTRVSSSFLHGRLSISTSANVCSNAASCDQSRHRISDPGLLISLRQNYPPITTHPQQNLGMASIPYSLIQHPGMSIPPVPGSFNFNVYGRLLNAITEPGLRRILPVGIPNQPNRKQEDPLQRSPLQDPSNNQNLPQEDPTNESTTNIEKIAARLIVIRRIKMNKHKLKKLRKKMKFIWAKRKLRREMRKERAFLDRHLERIRAAERFDAKEHVAMLIAKAKEKPLPRTYKGKAMPAWWIKQQIALGNIKV